MAGPNNGFACNVYHERTGKALYGFEPAFERALGWLNSARLIFTETGDRHEHEA